MVGWVYKILSKVLACRLKLHLSSIIGESQAAFIEGKQILDVALVANEAIHSWKNSSNGGLILKIDFEKVYDCVNWGFLLNLLGKFGFGENGVLGLESAYRLCPCQFLLMVLLQRNFIYTKGFGKGVLSLPFCSTLWWKG